jgi:hypothetical protein
VGRRRELSGPFAGICFSPSINVSFWGGRTVINFPDFWQSVRTTFRIGLPVAVVLTSVLIALSFAKPLARPLAFIEEKLIDYRMERAWDGLPGEYPSVAVITQLVPGPSRLHGTRHRRAR